MTPESRTWRGRGRGRGRGINKNGICSEYTCVNKVGGLNLEHKVSPCGVAVLPSQLSLLHRLATSRGGRTSPFFLLSGLQTVDVVAGFVHSSLKHISRRLQQVSRHVTGDHRVKLKILFQHFSKSESTINIV